MKAIVKYFIDTSPVVRTIYAPKIVSKIHADGRGMISTYNEDGLMMRCLIVRRCEEIDVTDQLLAD